MFVRVPAQGGHVEMELAPGSLGSNLISSAYSAYLFYKWAAEADSEHGPDPDGEAVNPAQIVE